MGLRRAATLAIGVGLSLTALPLIGAAGAQGGDGGPCSGLAHELAPGEYQGSFSHQFGGEGGANYPFKVVYTYSAQLRFRIDDDGAFRGAEADLSGKFEMTGNMAGLFEGAGSESFQGTLSQTGGDTHSFSLGGDLSGSGGFNVTGPNEGGGISGAGTGPFTAAFKLTEGRCIEGGGTWNSEEARATIDRLNGMGFAIEYGRGHWSVNAKSSDVKEEMDRVRAKAAAIPAEGEQAGNQLAPHAKAIKAFDDLRDQIQRRNHAPALKNCLLAVLNEVWAVRAKEWVREDMKAVEKIAKYERGKKIPPIPRPDLVRARILLTEVVALDRTLQLAGCERDQGVLEEIAWYADEIGYRLAREGQYGAAARWSGWGTGRDDRALGEMQDGVKRQADEAFKALKDSPKPNSEAEHEQTAELARAAQAADHTSTLLGNDPGTRVYDYCQGNPKC
ncbi:MAG: hypothetical protein HYU28_10940 [Actinobacteria bacterium]|nr:hypothetical protein [Actinomycetota bacterium]